MARQAKKRNPFPTRLLRQLMTPGSIATPESVDLKDDRLTLMIEDGATAYQITVEPIEERRPPAKKAAPKRRTK